MLAKRLRLKSSLFERVFHRSQRIKVGSFLFCVSFSPVGREKFAVVVGKKNLPEAVIRNRLRRQLYELFRLFLVPQIQGKNVILLYNGGKVLQNRPDLLSVSERFLDLLKTASSRSSFQK